MGIQEKAGADIAGKAMSPVSQAPGSDTYASVGGQVVTETVDVKRPWAGRPGQFSSKTSIQNGLDAINKAGASLTGFLGGNRNDLALVKKYYTQNPAVANQYDLPVNLFLRYISGVGDKGLQVSQDQGKKVLAQIEGAKQGLSKRVNEMSQYFKPEYVASFKRKIAKGMIPVMGNAFNDQEVGNSLGRFWATPQKDGSYVITEDFDFPYAPKSKGGSDGMASSVGSLRVLPTLEASNYARMLVSAGHGQPFKYRLRIAPDGQTQVLPVSPTRKR